MSMHFAEIGQQLRAYRLESGLRAEEIAARLGVSRAALYRYEKGEVIKLDTIKRLAELLKISPLSLLGIGVEYYNRPIAYFERIRQIEETADQILQLFGPVCYLTTSEAYDQALAEVFDEAAEQVTAERTAMRSMAERVLGILTARKRMYATRRPGIIAMMSLSSVQRLLDDGVAGGIQVSDRMRRICREVAVAEVENVAGLMEAEPMGLQFGLLIGAEPSSAFKILRARDRVSLAINPFRTNSHPSANTGVAMITGADEAIAAHQQVAEAKWREAVKGAVGATRLRQLVADGGARLTAGVGAAAPHLYAGRMASRSFPALPAYPGVDICSEQRVWSGRFPLDVVRFRHRRFDGDMSGVKTWEVWRRGRAAAVLPYDPVADAVVLIEQFRLPALVAGLDPVLVELPAGLCDDGETPEATARREMMEEMGLAVGVMRRIGGFLLTPGGADEVCELYAGRVQAPDADADGIAGHAGMAEEHEDIRVRVWPADRAIDAALDGQMTNSLTTIGLLWLAARREALRKEWMAA